VTEAPQRPTPGERWARDELARLRAARFSGSAIVAFLAASHRRAGDVRARRPELARQAHAWTATGAGAWACLAAGGVEPFRRLLGRGLAWCLFAGLMLDWHLGMVETSDGRPRRLGPADALTLARAWLVPLIADDPHAAALLIAAATDVLDGAAARARAPTRAGREFDGIVDTAIIAAALAGAQRRRLLSGPTIAVELTRLGAGAGYATCSYFARATRPDPDLTKAARLATPLRLAGLVSASLGHRRAADRLVTLASLASLALAASVWARERAPADGAARGSGLPGGRGTRSA
jgi:phosphatidylglycerophosphate synthase